MHALNLNYLTQGQVYALYKLVAGTISNKLKGLLSDKLGTKNVSISNPYNFYHFRLKRLIRNKFRKSCYRTYTLTGISNVIVVDYKFGQISQKQQLKRAKQQQKKQKQQTIKKKRQQLKNKKIQAAKRRKQLIDKKKSVTQSKNKLSVKPLVTAKSKLQKKTKLGK